MSDTLWSIHLSRRKGLWKWQLFYLSEEVQCGYEPYFMAARTAARRAKHAHKILGNYAQRFTGVLPQRCHDRVDAECTSHRKSG